MHDAPPAVECRRGAMSLVRVGAAASRYPPRVSSLAVDAPSCVAATCTPCEWVCSREISRIDGSRSVAHPASTRMADTRVR